MRGASVGGTRLVGEFDVSYDFPSGVYLNGSAFGGPPVGNVLGLAGVVGDFGYARRMDSGLSIDGGLTRLKYFGVGPNGYSAGYTEIYGGAATPHLSARLYYSPDHFRSGVETLYGELGGNLELAAEVRMSAHFGALGYLSTPPGFPPARTQYDWLIGASRQFGAADLHFSVSGGEPNEPYSSTQPRFRTALIVGAGYTF